MRKIIAALIALAIIISLALVYLLALRPKDSDYSAGLTQLSQLQQANTRITKAVSTLTTPYAATNADNIFILKANVTQFDKLYSTFVNLPIINHDAAIHDVYSHYSSVLTNYRKAADDLLVSVQSFNTVTVTCGAIGEKLNTITTTAAFDSSAKACNSAIQTAQSAPDAAFRSQLLDYYLKKASATVAAYRGLVEARASKKDQSSAIAAANQAAQDLSATRVAKLSLTLSPDPTNALQKLTSVVSSEQKKLIR